MSDKEKTSTCERVIVVGNSTSVLSEELGSTIDSYDIVVRINHCVTKGYEKFIGKKIDIWSTTNTDTSRGRSTAGTYKFIPENFSSLESIWHRTIKTYCRSMIPQHEHISEYVMYKTNDFRKNFGHLVDSNWFLKGTNQEMCTGLLTILTSTLFYKDVTVVGFTFYTEDNAQKKADYSYYRRDQLDSEGNHFEDSFWQKNQERGFTSLNVGNKKKQLLKDMSKSGIIKLLNEKELEDTEYENTGQSLG